MRHRSVGCGVTASVLVLLVTQLPLDHVAAQERASWVRSHSALERTIARLTEATSSSERVVLAERLARLGPPERAASGIAAALAVELEPHVRQALLTAAIRVAVLDAGAASVLAPIAIQRFGEATSPEGRAGWARLLGWLATDDAIAALMVRADEEAVADALVQAHAIDALLTGLGTDADRAVIVPLLGRARDPRAVEPLFALLGAEGDVSTLEALSLIAEAGDDPTVTSRVRDAVLVSLRGSEDARRLMRLFDALGRLGPLHIRPDVLETHLTDPEPAVAEAALRCAHALDSGWAAAFAATLPPDDARLAPLLAMSDEPALVPLATTLATREGARDLSLDFLVRARDGAGLDALIAVDAPPLVIAVASRRWLDRRGDATPSGAAHRALAGGAASFEAMRGDRSARLSGAIALALALAPPRGPLAEWIQTEPDRAVRAWLLEAVRRHHVALDAHWLRGALDPGADPGADPAVILAVPWAEGSSSDRRALGRALSRFLRTGAPPQVAAAAWSLSAMGARDASAALEALLEDRHPTVRIAAARALEALRPERSRYVRARGAIDPDPRAARLLSDPLACPASLDVLFLDVTVMGDAPSSAPWLEVQTDDGLLRQLPAAPDGTFALIDVPGRLAEVRLIIRD